MPNKLNHFDIIKLNAGNKSRIEVLRVGKVLDRNLDITDDMLSDFVTNYYNNVYGTEIQVNLGHNREGEAAGWIVGLSKEGGILFADVEWTPLGVEKITSKQYKFTSSELSLSYPDHKTGQKVKHVFTGVGLTNVPAVKGMAPVSLSEDLTLFFKDLTMKVKKLYDSLMAKKSLTEEEVKEFADAVGDAEGDDVTEMKKQIAAKKVTKLSEQEAEAKEEEKKEEKAEEKKEDDKTNLSETMLNEKLSEMKAANFELSQKVAKMELNEVFDKELNLSTEISTGFMDAQKEPVVAFMLSLSANQLAQFKAIVKEVKTVDLSERGQTVKKAEETDAETKLSELEKKANQLALSDKSKTEAEHLSDLIVEAKL